MLVFPVSFAGIISDGMILSMGPPYAASYALTC